MGTDIHFYVERRNGKGWVSCDQWAEDECEPGRKSVPYGKHFYSSRSYDTFAILAGVRNGRGFAGVDTGDGFEPIAEPRGLPEDMSPELRAEADDYMDHTPSWLTVKELMDYDWTKATTKRGWVNGPQFTAWSRFDRGQGHGPREWCGGVDGLKIEHITDDEMAKRVQNITDLFKGRDYREMETAIKDRLGSTYCQVSWQIPYYRAASLFLSETLPRLWRLGPPEDVRAVFWFDS